MLYNFEEEGAVIRGFVRASDGNLYGITRGISRDRDNCGTIFRIGRAGQVNAAYVFKHRSGSNGWNWFSFDDPVTPVSRLLPGSDGKLYGLTRNGGKRDAGVLFQFDPSDSFVASKEETARAEEIASNAIPPPELRRPAIEAETEERKLADSMLDIPGMEPGLANYIPPAPLQCGRRRSRKSC